MTHPNPHLATLETILERLLLVGLVAVPFAALASSFLLTLGNDEAWFLGDVRRLVEEGVYGGGGKPPGLTTGGIYTLVTALLSLISGGKVWVVRLLAVASLSLLLWLVARWAGDVLGNRIAGLLVAACVMAVPRSLSLGATAYGTLPAALLVFAGAILWSRLAPRPWHRVIAVGALMGMAAATRWECVAALPALVGAAFLTPSGRRHELRDAIGAASLGGLLCAALIWLLVSVSDLSAGYYYENFGAFNLLSINPVIVARNWMVAIRFAPFPILVFATVAWAFVRGRCGHRAKTLDVIVWFSWIQWATWTAFAEFSYLRYLWPSLAGFAMLLGFALGAAYRSENRTQGTPSKLAALLVGLACLTAGYASTLRADLMGDSDLAGWEWSGYAAPTFRYRPLDRLIQQARMAEYLERAVAADETVMVIGLAQPQAYLTRRNLVTAEWLVITERWEPTKLPRRLLVTPAAGTMVRFTPELRSWINSHCVREMRFGKYDLYRVIGDYPQDPSFFF